MLGPRWLYRHLNGSICIFMLILDNLTDILVGSVYTVKGSLCSFTLIWWRFKFNGDKLNLSKAMVYLEGAYVMHAIALRGRFKPKCMSLLDVYLESGCALYRAIGLLS